jgi:energy-coupling factor transporter ATP-binding protein EcfA2
MPVSSSKTVIAPNQRFAIIGKSGCGKTLFTIVLACLLVAKDDPDWQIWWLDSKNTPADHDRLYQWGFTRDLSNPSQRKLIFCHDETDTKVAEQANYWCVQALKRHNVLVVIDEYSHACVSSRRTGNGIAGIHKRGRGLNVGIIGETQEPCTVPRLLFSQALHVIVFDVAYPLDIAKVREFCPIYERAPKGYPHGFWWGAVETQTDWAYHPHVRAWYASVQARQVMRGQQDKTATSERLVTA